uniref:Uncharacterized protein n=1 Tax=Cacopsylla melanoneura TaxID=428564 RepID=A0A8D8TL44_9HEMI
MLVPTYYYFQTISIYLSRVSLGLLKIPFLFPLFYDYLSQIKNSLNYCIVSSFFFGGIHTYLPFLQLSEELGYTPMASDFRNGGIGMETEELESARLMTMMNINFYLKCLFLT